MSAPVSPEEVCNLSLDLLRHNTKVTSIETPETDEENLGARWYDATRRSLLRMFPWNFARKRSTCPRNATTPAFGYTDAYDLPNDYEGLVFIGEDQDDRILDYSVEGGQILVNNDGASSLNICYVYDIVDVTRFDPIFLKLLVGELAVMFSHAIAGLNKSVKTVEAFRDRWELKARSKNGQENPPRVIYRGSVINRRIHSSSGLSSDGIHISP